VKFIFDWVRQLEKYRQFTMGDWVIGASVCQIAAYGTVYSSFFFSNLSEKNPDSDRILIEIESDRILIAIPRSILVKSLG
jgi:hypothetical protein